MFFIDSFDRGTYLLPRIRLTRATREHRLQLVSAANAHVAYKDKLNSVSTMCSPKVGVSALVKQGDGLRWRMQRRFAGLSMESRTCTYQFSWRLVHAGRPPRPTQRPRFGLVGFWRRINPQHTLWEAPLLFLPLTNF